MDTKSFISSHTGPSITLSDESSRLLENPRFREDILRVLHRDASIDASALLKYIFELEAAVRREEIAGEYYENLYWSAFLLWRIGDINHVIPFWHAKHINMDTGFGFDIQFLVGAGVNETIRYLKEKPDHESRTILAYITECRDGGEFDNLTEWAEHKTEYFADI